MPTVTYVRGPDCSGPRAFLAIPTSGDITPPCVASLMEAMLFLPKAGVGVDYCIEAGNCHVDDARNSLVREFLKTDCTDLVFIDADVGFRAEDLLRLITFDRDVVGGVYPKKQDDEDYPVFVEGGTTLQAEPDGLVEVHGLPTGFLRIRRHVLEQLAAQAVSFIGQAGDPVPYHVIFERVVEGGRRWSGDYAFCRKWRALGGKLYVDPEMGFTHTGSKTWAGTLGAFWKRRHGVSGQAFDQAIEALKRGDPEPEDFKALSEGWESPWAASPELLMAAYRMAKGDVIECGSGLTTLVMATRANVVSLEHNPAFATHTQAMLERYGLSAEIQCRPLVDGWYAADPGSFDMALVDGPPRNISDRRIALERITADAWLWDDYDGAPIPGRVEVIEGAKTFAIGVSDGA